VDVRPCQALVSDTASRMCARTGALLWARSAAWLIMDAARDERTGEILFMDT
jgi:hypothetical protein